MAILFNLLIIGVIALADLGLSGILEITNRTSHGDQVGLDIPPCVI